MSSKEYFIIISMNSICQGIKSIEYQALKGLILGGYLKRVLFLRTVFVFLFFQILLIHGQTLYRQNVVSQGDSHIWGSYYLDWNIGEVITENNFMSESIVSSGYLQPFFKIDVNSNSPVCLNDSLFLQADSFPGVTYHWIGPNGYTSMHRNPKRSNFSSNDTGLYILTGLHPDLGVFTDSIRIEENYIQPPTITGSLSVLNGQSTLLIANGVVGLYSWWDQSTGGSQLDTGMQYLTPSLNQSSVYYASVSVNSCSSARTPVYVSVIQPTPSSISTSSPYCEGSPVYFNVANQVPFGTYLWTGPNGYTSRNRQPGISNSAPSMSGFYTLQVDSAAVIIFSDSVYVQINALPSRAGIISNSPVCIQNTLTLSVPFNSNASYTWSGPSGLLSVNTHNLSISEVGSQHQGLYSLNVSVPGCLTVNLQSLVYVNGNTQLNPGSNSPVCAGSAIYLTTGTQPGGTVYSWSGPGGFISGLQNPSISNVNILRSGSYTLTALIPGCFSPVSAVHNVIVNTRPSHLLLGSNSPICSGNNLFLSTIPVANGSFAWSGPNGFNSNQYNPTILSATQANNGRYTVSVNIPGCNSITQSIQVIVNDVPVVIPGSNSPVCQGSVLYLTSNSIVGASYQWSGPMGFFSSNLQPGISNAQPHHSGVYSLHVQIPGCLPIVNTIGISVNESLRSVQIGSSMNPICVASNLVLSGTQLLGHQVEWSGPNGFSSNEATVSIPNLQLSNAGRYTYTVHSPGCGSVTRLLNLSVSSPVISASIAQNPVCVGAAVYFMASAQAGTTYSWSGPVGFNSGVQNPSRIRIQQLHAGIYTVSGSIPGCGIRSATVPLTVISCREGDINNTVTDNLEGDSLLDLSDRFSLLGIYPNPTNGIVNISFNDNSLHPKTLNIFDIHGRKVMVYGRKLSSSNEATIWHIDFNGVSKGIYFVQVISGTEYHTSKLIVQ